jgi:predicted transcriptional regulator YdeE
MMAPLQRTVSQNATILQGACGMDNKADYSILIKKLDSPVFVVGQEVRVKHGTPECFPAINALCTSFKAENIPAGIRNKTEPVLRLGLCIDHVYYDDIIEFTYVTGVQVHEPAEESTLPKATKCYAIPAGEYACIKVSSPDEGTTIGIAYTCLDNWINGSQDWDSTPGEYEVYPNISDNTEMELWRPVKRKGHE